MSLSAKGHSGLTDPRAATLRKPKSFWNLQTKLLYKADVSVVAPAASNSTNPLYGGNKVSLDEFKSNCTIFTVMERDDCVDTCFEGVMPAHCLVCALFFYPCTMNDDILGM